MIDHPARARVAEIMVGRRGEKYTRGSGYLVSPGWVLTACHVVADAVSVGVWFGAPTELASQAGVGVDVGRALMVPAADLALLPVGGPADDPRCESALLGRLDREPGPSVPVAAAGCPRFKLRPAPGRPGVLLRELHYAIGSIAALSDAKTGRFAFAVDVAPGPDPEPDTHSPWEGMSGAAVWANGRLIGVVGQHHPQEGLATLTVRPIEQLFGSAPEDQLDAWRAALPRLPAMAEGLWLATPPTVRKIEVARARRAAEALAPRVPLGRSAELAVLETFASSGARWRWIQGDAFAGKTALLAWFALHPPESVDVAACFLRRASGEDTAEYALDVLTRQLALLADRRDYLPPLSVSRQRNDFTDLLEEAARACAERGRRLLVLLDGLDEYDPATGSLDLADWLPDHSTLPDQAILLAASRAGADVRLPPAHPLRSFVQRITPSEAATEIRHAARGELDRAVRARGTLLLPLLCCLAVAGSGLTASEMRALLTRRGRDADISEIEAELSSSLRSSLMRLPHPDSIGTRAAGSQVYAFAHDTLLAEARSQVASDLATYESLFDAWADDYARDSWPGDTPQYLLAPYTRELARRARDPAAPEARGATAMSRALDRLSALARSPSRHVSLLRATGSDYAALTEIRNAQDLIAAQDAPDLRALVELCAYRHVLSSRNKSVPIILPAVWAGLRRFERAEGLARSISNSREQARSFIELVVATAQAGELDRAEALVDLINSSASQANALARLAVVIGLAGDWERADRMAEDAADLARTITDPSIQSAVLAILAISRAGNEDDEDRAIRIIGEAEAVACTIRSPGIQSRVQAGLLVGAIAITGYLDYAESFARSITDIGFRSWAFGRLAAIIGSAGYEEWAARLADEADAVARGITDPQGRTIRAEVELQMTRVVDGFDGAFRAEIIAGPYHQGEVFAGLAAIAAETGGYDRAARLAGEAEAFARTITDRGTVARVLTTLAAALAIHAGSRDRAARLAGEAEALARTFTSPDTQAEALAWLAAAASQAGDRDRAARLAGEAEALARTFTSPDTQAEVLAGLSAAAANAGDRDRAVQLADKIGALAPHMSVSWGNLTLVREINQPADVYWAEALMRAVTERSSQRSVLDQLVLIACQTGDLDRAEALVRSVAEPEGLAWLLVYLADTAGDAGDRDRAVRLIGEAETLARTISEPDSQARALVHVAAAIGRTGDLDRAEALARAITPPRSQAKALADLAGAAREAGNRDRAVSLIGEAETLARTISEPHSQARALADLAATIGRTGDLDRAGALARTIADSNARAEVCAGLATTAGQAGKLDRAQKLLALALTAEISKPGQLIKEVSRIFPSIIKDAESVVLSAYQVDT